MVAGAADVVVVAAAAGDDSVVLVLVSGRALDVGGGGGGVPVQCDADEVGEEEVVMVMVMVDASVSGGGEEKKKKKKKGVTKRGVVEVVVGVSGWGCRGLGSGRGGGAPSMEVEEACRLRRSLSFRSTQVSFAKLLYSRENKKYNMIFAVGIFFSFFPKRVDALLSVVTCTLSINSYLTHTSKRGAT